MEQSLLPLTERWWYPICSSLIPNLFHDSRQPFVGADCHILKLPRWLARWWPFLPFELPRESSGKWPRDDAQRASGELGKLFDGFLDSGAVQFRVDVDGLHDVIISVLRGKVADVSSAWNRIHEHKARWWNQFLWRVILGNAMRVSK